MRMSCLHWVVAMVASSHQETWLHSLFPHSFVCVSHCLGYSYSIPSAAETPCFRSGRGAAFLSWEHPSTPPPLFLGAEPWGDTFDLQPCFYLVPEGAQAGNFPLQTQPPRCSPLPSMVEPGCMARRLLYNSAHMFDKMHLAQFCVEREACVELKIKIQGI